MAAMREMRRFSPPLLLPAVAADKKKQRPAPGFTILRRCAACNAGGDLPKEDGEEGKKKSPQGKA